MNFNEIFLNTLISTFTGIIGGLAVYWFFKGVHLFDKGLKFNINNLKERYLWKYLFIICFLFLLSTIISILFALLFQTSPIPSPIISVLAIICAVFIIVTLWLKLR